MECNRMRIKTLEDIALHKARSYSNQKTIEVDGGTLVRHRGNVINEEIGNNTF